MDKDKLAKLLMAMFLEELGEHVRALNHDLLALEQNPSAADRAELWKVLFRSAHSMKGAARAVNVELIERVCHHLEEILTSARDGQLTLTPALFALLFETADAIESAGARLREQQSLDDSPLAKLLPRLEATTQDSLKPEAQAKDAPDAPSLALQASMVEEPAIPPSQSILPRSTSGSNTIRVTAEKLDALLAQSGELLVARRRVASRDEALAGIRESLAEWRAEWKGGEKPLHDFRASTRTQRECRDSIDSRRTNALAREQPHPATGVRSGTPGDRCRVRRTATRSRSRFARCRSPTHPHVAVCRGVSGTGSRGP